MAFVRATHPLTNSLGTGAVYIYIDFFYHLSHQLIRFSLNKVFQHGKMEMENVSQAYM